MYGSILLQTPRHMPSGRNKKNATSSTSCGRLGWLVSYSSKKMDQILYKMVWQFHKQNIGQNGFLVGHVRCPAFISTTGAYECVFSWTIDEANIFLGFIEYELISLLGASHLVGYTSVHILIDLERYLLNISYEAYKICRISLNKKQLWSDELIRIKLFYWYLFWNTLWTVTVVLQCLKLPICTVHTIIIASCPVGALCPKRTLE